MARTSSKSKSRRGAAAARQASARVQRAAPAVAKPRKPAKAYPALAIVEFCSIADGIYCTDAMLKRAPIAMLKSGTVSRGRYLVVIGGSTASVDEALQAALAAGQGGVVDHVFLPDVHVQVLEALLGKRATCAQDAVAILETDTVAANVRAAELAIKGTEVLLVELRLAEYEMSGKAISVYNGELPAVQAAMEMAEAFLRGRKDAGRYRIISRPHEALTQQLTGGTRFEGGVAQDLDGESVG